MRTTGMVLVVLFGILIIPKGDLAADQEAGSVLTFKRNVFLIRDGQQEAAAAQSPLFLKDAVATDKGSRTKLFFSDDSILNLGELSHLVVEEYLYAEGQDRATSVYRLVEGSLRVVVGKSGLEIHTPTAVAAWTAGRRTVPLIWRPSNWQAGACRCSSWGCPRSHPTSWPTSPVSSRSSGSRASTFAGISSDSTGSVSGRAAARS